MEVRLAELDDADALGLITASACAAGYRGLVPDQRLDALLDDEALRTRAALLRSHLESGDLHAYVARSTGAVGWIGWYADGDHAEVDSLYVAPAHWGTPAAAALVAEAMRREQRLELWTVAANHRARRFYERTGFRLGPLTRTIEYLGVDLEQARYIWP